MVGRFCSAKTNEIIKVSRRIPPRSILILPRFSYSLVTKYGPMKIPIDIPSAKRKLPLELDECFLPRLEPTLTTPFLVSAIWSAHK